MKNVWKAKEITDEYECQSKVNEHLWKMKIIIDVGMHQIRIGTEDSIGFGFVQLVFNQVWIRRIQCSSGVDFVKFNNVWDSRFGKNRIFEATVIMILYLRLAEIPDGDWENKSKHVHSICMKEFHCSRTCRRCWSLGLPVGSPAVQSIPRQATITDTLRSKRSTKTYLHSLKPHFLNLFWPRELRRQIVVSSARITLNPGFLQRKTDKFPCDMDFSQQHETPISIS